MFESNSIIWPMLLILYVLGNQIWIYDIDCDSVTDPKVVCASLEEENVDTCNSTHVALTHLALMGIGSDLTTAASPSLKSTPVLIA